MHEHGGVRAGRDTGDVVKAGVTALVAAGVLAATVVATAVDI